MEDVPHKVVAAFAKLKDEFDFPIFLRKLNGHFYVYRGKSWWDKDAKKVKSSQEYVGRLLEDGAFVRKLKLSDDRDLEVAKAVILARGGVIHFPQSDAQEAPRQDENALDEADRKILTSLSMNGRAHASAIAKKVGLSVSATEYRIGRLEHKYGIRYLAELNTHKLGFIQYVLFVKFSDVHPGIEEARTAASEEPKVQFAALTKGDYDMVMYILDENSETAMDTMVRLRMRSPLKPYEAKWWLSPISLNYGFIPLRDAFLEKLLKGRIWARSKETPRPGPHQLMQREFDVIRALNSDGTKEFSEIDAENGLPSNTSRYTYLRLKDKVGMINRITITMDELPMKYLDIILLELKTGEAAGTRAEFLREIIEYGRYANKYSYEGDIGAPQGIMLFMPVMDDREADAVLEDFSRKVKGIRPSMLPVTTVLVGNLCYRRFDNTYSRQSDILVSEFKAPHEKKEQY